MSVEPDPTGELAALRDELALKVKEVGDVTALAFERYQEAGAARNALQRAEQRVADLERALDGAVAGVTLAGGDRVLYAYNAWSCLVDGGCGSRYTTELATVDHPCGPLTPVVVTISRRPA